MKTNYKHTKAFLRSLGRRRFDLIRAELHSLTKVRAREIIGKKPAKAGTWEEAITLALDAHREQLNARATKRQSRMRGYVPSSLFLPAMFPAKRGLSVARMLRGPRHRLEGRIKEINQAAGTAILRLLGSPSGDASYSVSTVQEWSATGATVATSQGEQYSRACTYRKLDLHLTVRVMEDYRHSVVANGLERVDGLPTIAAQQVLDGAREGEQIFRAKWAEKGRGFSLTVQEGYILRVRGEGRTYTAHGATIGIARALITRQQPAWQAAQYEREQEREERIERIRGKLAAGQVNGWGDVVVTVSDSARAGNCDSGTRSWINSHLDGRASATVGEILEVDDQKERVLLACMAAIRRSRSTEIMSH